MVILGEVGGDSAPLYVFSWDRLVDFIPSVQLCGVCLMLLVGRVQAWP